MGLLISLLLGASTPAETQVPVGRWIVHADEQQCSLLRRSAGAKPVTFAIRVTPGADDAELLVIAETISSRELRDVKDSKLIVTPQRAQLPGEIHSEQLAGGNALVLAALRDEVVPALSAGSGLDIRQREKQLASMALPGVPAALQALKRCEESALVEWGVDLAARPLLRKPARPVRRLASLLNDNDYPQSAVRANESGNSVVRMTVGPDGRVADCVTVASSGSNMLDSATCSLFARRARFSPALAADGRPTQDWHIARIRWRLAL